MRLVIATCTVDNQGRLSPHKPRATRQLKVKYERSVYFHADDRAYKPLNWMSPPCQLREEEGRWVVVNQRGETLTITIEAVLADHYADLGTDPGLEKDGVESHLQELLAARPDVLAKGLLLVSREFPTDIGPVDLLCRDANGAAVAVEIKRRGEIDGVEQLARYLERLDLDGRLRPVRGILAAQQVKPQARVLAAARGITCVEIDYDRLRGESEGDLTLF